MSYIIKMGGSLLFNKEGTIKIDLIKEFATLVKNSGVVGGIVCGGGIIARKYIQAARKLGVNESNLDQYGIEVSRLNSKIIIDALGGIAYEFVIKNIEEAM